ncbi:MAG: sigma-70 family RNA polymerase sigma factor [Lentimicrobiaceae bacterium]|jgi:RNA polymerase sigma-70 factor (ECF subfamily)|nr:sigma-70 family RNA polymerase sigma factor [Lentimicrobiaceae bacterium]MCP4911247.1 sigma-70 family RNA polymerase sigma factor [Bacteroidota bacterium]MBT3453957.1 sigma-70 family RNA polymerase sigma factor [Lentimicrobiaceae bacterium]MBT3818568.1 sigma-70 family RNA polymerase sigma factor [Lentimicrobiaceae bacterium]MBT4061936.1 sigma-70 family RNA polymerase sigma factor [Lentimicrobiaceae bacterium]
MSKVTLSEKELVKSFINGDHSSLQILIERHQNRLYSYIFLLVKDKQLADDIFQDTYVKVINTLRRGAYNDEGKFIQWVMRIAHNLVIDHFRKSKKVPTVDNSYNDFDVFDTVKFTDPSIEEQLVLDQIHTDVRKLLEFLPEEQREVLYLRCYSGLSFKDIAEQTDVSINTALGRMRYAIINMRKIIEENKVILTS